MKKFLAWLLLAASVLSLWGCATAYTEPQVTLPPETLAPVETAAETIPETVPPVTETEPPILEGNLYLKVSSLTFSLVGESEDIYMGFIPRELVSWESDDPNIVSVENGVLTATGVGTTRIRGTYYDRQVECIAGCLAENRQALEALDFQNLSMPRRLPPEVDLSTPCTLFDKAAIVGDSITYYLEIWEQENNALGEMTFLARGGVSMNGFVRRYKNIRYQGAEMCLERAIAASGVERVYFLMGSNDVSSKNQRPHVFENWTIMLQRIRELSPDVEIVMLSNIPLYGTPKEITLSDFQTRNQRIYEYNDALKQYAEENGCLFLDLCYYTQDHLGYLPESYSQGSYHMNKAGCLNWMQILRFYAQYELEGGTLS